MTKLENYLLGIKRPKRFYLWAVLTLILATIFLGIYFFEICPQIWVGIVGAVSLSTSTCLFYLHLLICLGQTSDLLQKTYHDLRQYEIIFEELRHNVESAKECQKFMDDPQPSVLTFSEWVGAELKHIEEMIELMKEAVAIIKNNNNHISHDKD